MNEKQIAAEKAIEFIEDGMIVGLGSGSTFSYFAKKLAEKISDGLKITCISTSIATTKLADSLGIKTENIDNIKKIDLTVDGADEVDPDLNGIKGGGGALLYEKIVAGISDKNIWIVDSDKLVKKLGKFPLPVEVIPFGADQLFEKFKEQGFNPGFRLVNNNKYVTDAKHFIIDLHNGVINNAEELNKTLKALTGVVETGLFLNTADKVIVGRGKETEIIERL